MKPATVENPSQIITPAELRQRAGRICVAHSGAAMFHDAAAAAHCNPFVEFRLDSVTDPAAILPSLKTFLSDHRNITAIATCRRRPFGGAFDGTAQQQIAILQQAAQHGCRLVDIEVETAEELGQSALATLRSAGAAVILSWHDFAATPDLLAELQRMKPHQPDFYKLVPTAQSLRDSLQLIDLLQRHGPSGNLIAMSMGFKGVLTRVLGPRFGGAFTFAAPDNNAGTAPGQIGISTLRQLYRIDSITAETAIYAVAGHPITGSKSPLMHNTAFAACEDNSVYLPLETADADELHEAITALHIRGLSITMPLKETILPLLTHQDETVIAMRACNTLLRHRDGKLTGFNTDIAGIVDPLARRMDLHNARVLVLGAGGAARAAIYGLRQRGAHVHILNRTISKAQALATEFNAHVQPRETLRVTTFDIIVHTTPYGMRNQPIEAPITADELHCKLFFDLVYNPLETPLITAARAKGIEVIHGIAMFVDQGVRQFEIWTGRTAPEGDMARAVLTDLQQQAEPQR